MSSLEITEVNPIIDHENKTAVFTADLIASSMGQRILRREIISPLVDQIQIEKRLDLVEFLTLHLTELESLRKTLSRIQDIERIISRMTYAAATPSDAVSLRESIESFHDVDKWIKENSIFSDYSLDPVDDLFSLLKSAIAEDPQGDVGNGKVIADGFSKALDESRSILDDIDGYIKKYE
jgi:DNA mismatch repair protein MutS